MAVIRYATRDDVSSALDPVDSARLSGQVDRALDAATDAVFAATGRRFHPWIGTRELRTRLTGQGVRSGTLRQYLDDAECTALTSATIDGTTVDEWWLGPHDPDTDSGAAPFSYLDLVGGGYGTLTLTGTFGACSAADPVTATSGTVASTGTALAVADSARCGVGALLRVDTEWLAVTGQTFADTGQALTGDGLTESVADVVLTCASPAALNVGEVVQVDGEQMLVASTTPAGAVVERAYAGTVLAAHAPAAVVYARRALTVARGQCGSTPAAHTSGATVYRLTPPGLVVELAIAEALNTLAQEGASYARTVGSGDSARNASGAGLAALREQVRAVHGRGVRHRAI
jgi:hypothetical protein